MGYYEKCFCIIMTAVLGLGCAGDLPPAPPGVHCDNNECLEWYPEESGSGSGDTEDFRGGGFPGNPDWLPHQPGAMVSHTAYGGDGWLGCNWGSGVCAQSYQGQYAEWTGGNPSAPGYQFPCRKVYNQQGQWTGYHLHEPADDGYITFNLPFHAVGSTYSGTADPNGDIAGCFAIPEASNGAWIYFGLDHVATQNEMNLWCRKWLSSDAVAVIVQGQSGYPFQHVADHAWLCRDM